MYKTNTYSRSREALSPAFTTISRSDPTGRDVQTEILTAASADPTYASC
jgi:hypothetical protein